MREKATNSTVRRPSTFTFFLTMCAACVFSLSFVRAGEEHLPEKAETVAKKWIAFQKTAKPAEKISKRKEVIQYLGLLLKEEASKANLDGALAVKALMEKIENPTGQTKPAAKTPATEGLPFESFSIDSEAKRRLEFNFHINDDRMMKTIHCEIGGASDDTGDGGLEYELIDSYGKVAKRGKLSDSGPDLVTFKTRSGGDWKIAFIDRDTTFSAPYPGNNASVKIQVKRATSTVAAAR